MYHTILKIVYVVIMINSLYNLPGFNYVPLLKALVAIRCYATLGLQER